MKQSIIAVMLIFFSEFFSYSQNAIDVSANTDEQGNYTLMCSNNDLCNYVVEVYIQAYNLRGDFSMPYKFEVRPGQNSLLRLSPANINLSTSLKYSFSYFKGCLNPDVNLDFDYLLPLGKGKETEVYEMQFAKISNQDIVPKDWYVVGFKMQDRDTVYATRRGTVVELRDTTKLKLSGYGFSSDDNYIEVLHEDCSFGRYEVLSKILVKLGQKVEAGEPIGLAGGEKYSIGPHVRFSVYYNYELTKTLKNGGGNATITSHAYVPLFFHAKDHKKVRLAYNYKYISEHPDSLITIEMSKREIKKWMKSKLQP